MRYSYCGACAFIYVILGFMSCQLSSELIEIVTIVLVEMRYIQ